MSRYLIIVVGGLWEAQTSFFGRVLHLVWLMKETNVSEFTLSFQEIIYIYIYIYTNPSTRVVYNTRSISKRSLTGLNVGFSFSLTGCHTKIKEHSALLFTYNWRENMIDVPKSHISSLRLFRVIFAKYSHEVKLWPSLNSLKKAYVFFQLTIRAR